MNNIFDNIPECLDSELFEELIQNDKLKIERIISRGHNSLKSSWYDQDKNEWVMLLKGEAVLLFEDKSSIKLKEGDFINIPAHKKHKVKWTAPNIETIWLAVHY
jgi:cupin 2 domain-containing protein